MKNTEGRYYRASEDLSFEPVSPEEEQELFRAAKLEGPGGPIRERLIFRHLAYVLKLGRQYCGSKLPADETTSAANDALMKAIDSFNPERGTSFRAYLKPFVRAAIARTWRGKNVVSFKNTPPTAQVSLDDRSLPHQPEASESSTLEEEDHKDYLKEQLLEVANTLPSREQKVIHLHYVEMMNFAEIGRQLNFSREAIRLIHGRVLALLKKKLETRGITSTR